MTVPYEEYRNRGFSNIAPRRNRSTSPTGTPRIARQNPVAQQVQNNNIPPEQRFAIMIMAQNEQLNSVLSLNQRLNAIALRHNIRIEPVDENQMNSTQDTTLINNQNLAINQFAINIALQDQYILILDLMDRGVLQNRPIRIDNQNQNRLARHLEENISNPVAVMDNVHELQRHHNNFIEAVSDVITRYDLERDAGYFERS